MYTRTGLGDNAQIQPTPYTGPIGGFSCNTAGGYKLAKPSCYMTQQCMTDADLAAAEALCNAPYNPGRNQAQGGPVTITTGGGNTPLGPAAASGSSGSSAAAGPSMIDDAMAWVKANPLWAALGVGVVVLLLVKN